MSLQLILQVIGVVIAATLALRTLASRKQPSKPGSGRHGSVVAESIRATLGFQPLLRPSWNVDADAIRRIGRIPVELNFDATAVTRMWHVLKSLTLRPSSPKPVFAIQDTWLETAPVGVAGTGGFGLGGFVLTVVVAAQEDARHLWQSLQSGPFRSARIIVVCTPEEYLSPDAALRCYCVDVSLAHRPISGQSELLLPSSDENRLGIARNGLFTRGELPSDAVWLVRVPSEMNAGPAGNAPVEGTSRFLDPMTKRAPRYGGYFITVLSLAWTLVAASREMNAATAAGTQQTEQVFGAWSISLWPIFVLLGVPFCIWHSSQWRWERADKSAWVARTTRCLEDGQDAQNGFAQQRMRAERISLIDRFKQGARVFQRSQPK